VAVRRWLEILCIKDRFCGIVVLWSYGQAITTTPQNRNTIIPFSMFKKLLHKIVPPAKAKEEMPVEVSLTSGAGDTPATTQRLESLMNIDTAFQKTRLIAILSLVMSFLLCITVMIVAMTMVTKGKGKIYVTNGKGETRTAHQIAANENRSAEAKAQVRKFHTLLYEKTHR